MPPPSSSVSIFQLTGYTQARAILSSQAVRCLRDYALAGGCHSDQDKPLPPHHADLLYFIQLTAKELADMLNKVYGMRPDNMATAMVCIAFGGRCALFKAVCHHFEHVQCRWRVWHTAR